ncbi:unnamed protein product [Bursaphelenchus okinawaensis]|uniref:Tyrosine-protein phosphatase domain-containing protein n=1 Tax=Bursaphelenchus okinawaensis TaxID=465554 RepID=A0A811KMR0_9BILA|nr:unnamed protein product [Bursaphelenchus okinawaensis]CAG9106818.1 unnamed protein product [Bursaphelenchus okinawaensis]
MDGVMEVREPISDQWNEIQQFFGLEFDSRNAIKRFKAFKENIEADKDHVRVHGQYYNNIHLGKRIFGPARKQMFTSTIVGGMERRFEIIENPVNYIPFTSDAFEQNLDKCRNPRIKCKDDTRVKLRVPAGSGRSDFIHANWVKGPPLFNSFILTQAPMRNTIEDFWTMVTQEKVEMLLMLISRKETDRCARFWPSSGNTLQFGPFSIFTRHSDSIGKIITRYSIQVNFVEPETNESKQYKVILFQGDLNNSDNLYAIIFLLNQARLCKGPTVVIDHLGISRGACLLSVEICLMSIIRGPYYKHPAQRAVHFLRSCRPFSVETPMQYIFIHRVLLHLFRGYCGPAKLFEEDYARWLRSRSTRLFVDDVNGPIPPHRLLSPRVDPDLLAQANTKPRPNVRREIHNNIGELPQAAERSETSYALHLPNKYPRGKRYIY